MVLDIVAEEEQDGFCQYLTVEEQEAERLMEQGHQQIIAEQDNCGKYIIFY